MSVWTPINDFMDMFRGNSKSATVGYKSAAVWYALNRISGNVGTMAINLKRTDSDGEIETIKSGISYWTLTQRPSPIYGPLTFKQTLTAQALWYGNGRAYIHRDGRNSELIILDPLRTETGMVNGEKYHLTYINPQGDVPANRLDLWNQMDGNPEYTVTIPDADCFHLQGYGDGVQGVPIYHVAKTSLESMLGADSRTGDQINRGFVAKILLNAPADSPQFRSQKDANEFLEDFIKRHGADGANQQVGLLRGGITANSISAMDNASAQFTETKQFLRQDAALWFILESMLGDKESESFSSLEARQRSYLLNCLNTWLTGIEQEADYKLLTPTQFNSGNYYHQFDTEQLVQTNKTEQAQIISTLITARVISPNEARQRLGLSPYPEGDEFLNPAISESSAGETETEEPPAEEVPPVVEPDQAMNAIRKRINVLVNQERLQVAKRLKRGDTYNQIDKWYDGYSGRLGNAIEGLGGSRDVAVEHCVESLRQLASQPDELDLTGAVDRISTKILKGSHV